MGADKSSNGKRADTPASTKNGRGGLSTTDQDGPDDAADALALAEAEAEEADARAAAARARARAIRLRTQAEAEPSDPETDVVAEPESDAAVDEDADAVEDSVDEDTDAVEDRDGEDEDEAATAAPKTRLARARRRLLRRPSLKAVVVAIAIVFICACLAASGYLTRQHRNAAHERQRTAEFAAAARQGVVTLMSIDFNKAKEDIQRIVDSSTGDFKKDFQGTADDFIKAAQDSKAVTSTTVNATAVDSMTDNSAVVLVAATTKVTNTAGAKDEPRSWRLSVTMTRDGGQLKISKVEFVP